MRRRHWQRGTLRAERHLWNVPTAVAVTTALAQGGEAGGSTPPTGAIPFDEPTLKTGLTVLAGGNLSVPIPAVPAGRSGFVTALGLDTQDAVNTRVTTRVNGVAVQPLIGDIGSIGPSMEPVVLAAPIRLAAGEVFDLFIENIGAADIIIGPRIMGFTF